MGGGGGSDRWPFDPRAATPHDLSVWAGAGIIWRGQTSSGPDPRLGGTQHVPLDPGPPRPLPFAEPALPPALGIARRAGAQLDLVTVHASYDLEERIPRGVPFDPEREAERRRQDQAYLDSTAARAAAAGVAVTAAVLPGSAVSPAR